MRKFVVSVPFVAVVALCGCRHRDVAGEVIAREHQVAQGFNAGDAASERDLLAVDFVGTEPDGTRYDKAEAVKMVTGFKGAGLKLSSDGITVQAFGDVAVAHGFDHYRKADGTPLKTGVWTDVWVRRDGTWRMVAAQDGWMGH